MLHVDNGRLQMLLHPPTQSFGLAILVSSLQGTLNIADMGGRKLGSPESWRFEATLDDGHMVHAPVGSFKANPFGLHDMLGQCLGMVL